MFKIKLADLLGTLLNISSRNNTKFLLGSVGKKRWKGEGHANVIVLAPKLWKVWWETYFILQISIHKVYMGSISEVCEEGWGSHIYTDPHNFCARHCCKASVTSYNCFSAIKYIFLQTSVTFLQIYLSLIKSTFLAKIGGNL